MDESSGEKGECDENDTDQGRLVDKEPVSLETSWVRKLVLLRPLEDTPLVCGNRITK